MRCPPGVSIQQLTGLQAASQVSYSGSLVSVSLSCSISAVCRGAPSLLAAVYVNPELATLGTAASTVIGALGPTLASTSMQVRIRHHAGTHAPACRYACTTTHVSSLPWFDREGEGEGKLHGSLLAWHPH